MKGLVICQQLMPAWMSGNKSVTRRLMNPQPAGIYKGVAFADKMGPLGKIIKPRYHPGETVYIKETWLDGVCKCCISYRGDFEVKKAMKWKSPRFMPEWASRSHTLIVSVRPERVHEITEEEAKAEGVEPDRSKVNGMPPVIYSYRDSFRRLWESLHPGSWERNDFIWRIELEKK